MLRRLFWLFGIGLFLLVIFLPGFTKLQELRDKNQNLETNIKKLNVQNALLQEELKRIETDPVYQEKIAREKMGVVRKGEIPIQIVPEEKKKQ